MASLKEEADEDVGTVFDDVAAQLKAAMGGPPEEVSDATAEAVIAELLAEEEGAAEEEAEDAPPRVTADAIEALQRAGQCTKIATAFEQRGQPMEALAKYDEAIECFGQGLADPHLKPVRLPIFLPPGRNIHPRTNFLILYVFHPSVCFFTKALKTRVMSGMAQNLDRAQVLRVNAEPDMKYQSPKGRTAAIQAMSDLGFGSLARGVALRKAAAAKQAEGGDVRQCWQAFVYYTEAIDCMIAYARTKNPIPPPVSKALGEMLDETEQLKGHIPDTRSEAGDE